MQQLYSRIGKKLTPWHFLLSFYLLLVITGIIYRIIKGA